MKQDLNSEISKRVIYTLLTLSVLSSGVNLYALFTQDKLMYVDYNKLISGYQGMTAVRTGNNNGGWKANVDVLTNEIQRLMSDYEKQIDKMTMRERQLLQELIKTKQQQLSSFQSVKMQTWAEDDKVKREIMDHINAYLKTYGERHHYKIILATTDYVNLTLIDKSLDITGEVLAGMNMDYNNRAHAPSY